MKILIKTYMNYFSNKCNLLAESLYEFLAALYQDLISQIVLLKNISSDIRVSIIVFLKDLYLDKLFVLCINNLPKIKRVQALFLYSDDGTFLASSYQATLGIQKSDEHLKISNILLLLNDKRIQQIASSMNRFNVQSNLSSKWILGLVGPIENVLYK